MTTVAMTPAAVEVPERRSIIARITQNRWFEPFAVTVVLIFGFFGIPYLFDSFWVANFTQMAVFSIVASSACTPRCGASTPSHPARGGTNCSRPAAGSRYTSR